MPEFILRATGDGVSEITRFLTEDEYALVNAVFAQLNTNPAAEAYSPSLTISRPGDDEKAQAIGLLNSVSHKTGNTYCGNTELPVHLRHSLPDLCRLCVA